MASEYSVIPVSDIEDGFASKPMAVRSQFNDSTTSSNDYNMACTGAADSSVDLGDDIGEVGESHNEYTDIDEDTPTSRKLYVLLKSAFPIITSFFLGIGGSFINLMFAGHFSINNNSTAVIAGVSLANLFANVTFFSILIGMSSAIETIGSQHNGARNYREVGITLQRSVLIMATMSLPVVAIWFTAGNIFRFLGVEEDVCTVIKQYLRIRMLTMPVDIFSICYEKYLMSIGVTHPSMWTSISFNLLVLSLNSINVRFFHGHYTSLAWVWVISVYLSDCVQVVLSLRYKQVIRTLQPLDKDALKKWWQFLSLGLPGTVMICSEWWAYEILTLFASFLGTEEVAAQSIILQTSSLAYMVPLGLNIATASIVGNALGAGKKQLAMQIGKLALVSICVLEIALSLAIIFGGRYFVDCFTDDKMVQDVAISVMPFLSLFVFIDGLQGVCSGILRGAGRQVVGATANLLAFYSVGIPMAWFVCFRLKFRVAGLMIGLSVGTLLQVTVLLVLILCKEEFIYSKALVTQQEDASAHGSSAEEVRSPMVAAHVAEDISVATAIEMTSA